MVPRARSRTPPAGTAAGAPAEFVQGEGVIDAMLTSLKIKNFKAWKSTGDRHLAPLTVFFGTNSAGKTSITQFLLMLKQTIESSDRTRVLHPGDRNTLVDLGTFRDYVFDHRLDAPLSFSMSFSLPSRLTVKDPQTGQTTAATAMGFEATVRRHSAGENSERLRVESMHYKLFDENTETLAVGMVADHAPSGRRGKDKYRLDARHYRPLRNPGRKWPVPAPVRFYGFPDEAVAYYQNTGFLADLTLALASQFTRLTYVGPLRGYPARSYVWSGARPEHVGSRGEQAIEALLAADGRSISRGYRKRAEPFHKVIAKWLRELGMIHSFDARQISKERKEYEVLVRVRDGGSEVNITDVGFGLSQLLPVIVECFYVSGDHTVVFEQPETHLHPSAQAGLADLFIEAIHARENGQPRAIQLLVESHSEHFLRRLQRRIAEEKLSHEEVALYFCEPGPSGSSIRQIEVDTFGNILKWPTSFFGDDMRDIVAMTDAAMKRQTSTVG